MDSLLEYVVEYLDGAIFFLFFSFFGEIQSATGNDLLPLLRPELGFSSDLQSSSVYKFKSSTRPKLSSCIRSA